MDASPIFVVVGVGNATGTGASSARVFSRAGYKVAVIARRAQSLAGVVDEINQAGGEAGAFPVASYAYESFLSAFTAIQLRWPESRIRVALFNVGERLLKPFLDITAADIRASVDTNVVAAFAFAREAILAFQDNTVDDRGKRGTLLFTGATASVRGNVATTAFSAGKHGLRALSQSLAKEFGKQNIHVAHTVVDGAILTDAVRSLVKNKEWEANEDARLNPESIAKMYLVLANQDRSAWTWELDLRPAHEHW